MKYNMNLFFRARHAVGRLFASIVASLFLHAPALAGVTTTVVNFDSDGAQLVRFDTHGQGVDAHDGKIALFGGTYYLYGTSYDCGYQWQTSGAPFCGFKVYTSDDLRHWTDAGHLFDPTSGTWQSRCNGNTYGCFRPHVAYNTSTRQYVLWINVYDNSVGFRVFTASTPAGPFTETTVPTLAVNNTAPAGGVNNGDHDLFVDDDGAGYLAYTDWRSGGDIVVERLDASYLSGTGSYTRLHQSSTEAPAMFKRNGLYYLMYSDPNCGYCSGTGTSYRTALAPLGTWSAGVKVTDDSCGGQPAFVATIPTHGGTTYLYASDLWNNGSPNEALANYFWTPLAFASDSSIQPMACPKSFALKLSTGKKDAQRLSPDVDQTDGVNGFSTWCDIGGNIARLQTFIAGRSGTLTSASYTTFQRGDPDAGLELDIYPANEAFQPSGPALFSTLIPTHDVGWAPRDVTVYPNLPVMADARYAIVLKSATKVGCFGMVHNDAAPYPGGVEAYSSDGGATFAVEANRSTKFSTTVSGRTALDAHVLPAGWNACAIEHGVCNVDRPSVIAYGGGGSYVYRTVQTGPMPCTVAAFGTDPAYGTLKSCYLARAGGPAGYTLCAAKGGVCTFNGTKTVAYGSNGAYSLRQVTASTPCTTAIFGDPFISVAKSCYVSP